MTLQKQINLENELLSKQAAKVYFDLINKIETKINNSKLHARQAPKYILISDLDYDLIDRHLKDTSLYVPDLQRLYSVETILIMGITLIKSSELII